MIKIRILDLIPAIQTYGLKAAFEGRLAFREELLEQTGGLAELTTRFLDGGPSSLEGDYDAMCAAPYVTKMMRRAEEEGFDAAVIDCFMDPGMLASREHVRMPVVGACQSAVSMAARLGGEFSILNLGAGTDRWIKENLRRYGLISQLVSIRGVNSAVLDIEANADIIARDFMEAGEKAVYEDGAKAICFSCTGLSILAGRVRDGLKARGIDVPVIEPLHNAVYDAVNLVLMGVSHSKTAYQPNREKEVRAGWMK